MPVYEFYCPDCHKIFNFMSRTMNTKKRPNCPQCDRPKLERRVSMFAVSKGLKETDDGFGDIDESQMAGLEKAMESLAAEAEHMNEDDPSQMAGLMRKLYDTAGVELSTGMKEAISRLEAGEDPDQIEADLGDALDGEDPAAMALKSKQRLRDIQKKILPPSTDDNLYDL